MSWSSGSYRRRKKEKVRRWWPQSTKILCLWPLWTFRRWRCFLFQNEQLPYIYNGTYNSSDVAINDIPFSRKNTWRPFNMDESCTYLSWKSGVSYFGMSSLIHLFRWLSDYLMQKRKNFRFEICRIDAF